MNDAIAMRELRTERLLLEPLTRAHAEAMFDVLREPVLYRHLDDTPPASLESVRTRYARLESRRSSDGGEIWLNWVLRPGGGAPAGFVQATVLPVRTAWVAYVLSSALWGRGYASEAMRAMLEHLESDHGVDHLLATVERENLRSIRLLERLGFRLARAGETEGHGLSPTERLYVRSVPSPI